MIITNEQLIDIEETVGRSCEVSVISGPDQGSIIVSVCVEDLNRGRYVCENVFTHADHMNGEAAFKLKQFKHWAKNEFDNYFSK